MTSVKVCASDLDTVGIIDQADEKLFLLVNSHHEIFLAWLEYGNVSCCSIRSLELSATGHPVITLFDCFLSTAENIFIS